jgi:dUTPase
MYYSRIRDVKEPVKGHGDDAGIDFYVPSFDIDFVNEIHRLNDGKLYSITNEVIEVPPHQRLLIPSGIKVNLKKTRIDFTTWDGIMLAAHNKSGIVHNQGFIKTTEVVDEGYQGEIFIGILNTTNDYKYIKPNEKLIQFCLKEVSYSKPVELPIDSLYSDDSTRGEGALSSTGLI